MSDFKFKIETKRLQSGKFQVNFCTGLDCGYYGYLLAEPQTSVNEIISKINRHLIAFDNSERYFQRNLFSLGRHKTNKGRILIFKR